MWSLRPCDEKALLTQGFSYRFGKPIRELRKAFEYVYFLSIPVAILSFPTKVNAINCAIGGKQCLILRLSKSFAIAKQKL